METLSATTLKEQLTQLLQERFGLTHFRAGQLEAMEALFQQRRLLCIQPTGHGKSLLYQLPSMLLPGITLVISPLLALMRDQIRHLTQRFNISAGSINTDQTEGENVITRCQAKDGLIKILFVAPEKLDNLDHFRFLMGLPISLIVIDEAHCISTWGHDFRPSYRQILTFIKAQEDKQESPRVLAITATANAKTQADILEQLTFKEGVVAVHRHSMRRENLHLSVVNVSDTSEKLSAVKQLLEQIPGNGIIYCATRDNTELVASFLRGYEINAMAYHAGYEPVKKQFLQQQFIDNRYKAIAATNSLGMGIDKKDVRFIIHFDIPGSITAYYQEVGRGGRDGEIAHGILLFDKSDIRIQQHFIDSAQPNKKNFTSVLDTLRANGPSQLLSVKRDTGLHPTQVTVILAELMEQGFVNKILQNGKQLFILTNKSGQPELLRYERQYETRSAELKAIIDYTQEKDHCLMHLLSETLGDESGYVCGHCGNCSSFPFQLKKNFDDDIPAWLLSRNSNITLTGVPHAQEGVSLFDGQRRHPLFVEFMKSRTQENPMISPTFFDLMGNALKKLHQKNSFGCIVLIPSHTWQGRDKFGEYIANQLNLPLLSSELQWITKPDNRQGELLNNDQRRFNVDKKMQLHLQKPFPIGNILLVDDYTGSGATLKEACRALKPSMKPHHKIVPFAVAAVRWRLGKAGMI